MHKLNTIREDAWFCDLEHLYAYKAAQDIEWNPNYNLWIRVRHYTESTRNAGHSYDLNQDRIFRLAKIQLGESAQDIVDALEPQITDRYNQGYSNEEINLLVRASHVQLTETEEQELQRILAESFDTSHPDFSHQEAMENLHRNFCGQVALCKEYIHPYQRTDLKDNLCTQCYDELYPPTPEPEPEPEVLPIQPELPLPLPTLPEPNLNDLIKLLQKQIEQQAQVIDLLQEQAKTFEHQAQTIETLQNKVNSFERFHRQIGHFYEQFQQVDSEQATTSNDTQNF